jgi:hypothetical protein
MNCKPGDLAIMTHARGPLDRTGANIGRICEVVRAHGPKTYAGGDTLFCWWIRMVGRPGIDSEGFTQMEGMYPDAYLKPISGLPETVRTEDEVTA